MGDIKLNFAAAVFACSVASLVCLAGCAVQKEWTATGGSRADGTVELAYEYGAFQKPQVDDTQGVDLASSMCAGWGYTGSQPFGPMRKCEAVNGYGSCISWLVTRKYQCLGAPGPSTTPQLEAGASAATKSDPAQPKTNGEPATAPVPRVNPQVGDQWHSSE
jgi:hypothetical protein